MEDKYLQSIMSNLEKDFSGFRKELSKYNFVLDMSRVSSKTRDLATAALRAKHPNLRNYVDWDKDITVNKREGMFFVLRSKAEMNTVLEVLTEQAGLTKEGGVFKESKASQKRKAEFVFKRSNTARAKLAGTIADKTKTNMSVASPSFVAEFQDAVHRRINNYNIKFSLPTDLNKDLKDRLIDSAVGTIGKELKNIRPNSVLNNRIEERLETLGRMFEGGLSLKQASTTKNYKNKVVSKKRVKTNKNYHAPLQAATGLIISPVSLQNTLNLLLHDTIADKFMKPATAPSDRNYLRYQTGRFARSAQVENVTVSDPNVIVDFSYMTDPYITFTSGSNNGPGRDPTRIIGAAIRDIMIRHVHEKFTTITRVISGGSSI